jgi:MFS family permease
MHLLCLVLLTCMQGAGAAAFSSTGSGINGCERSTSNPVYPEPRCVCCMCVQGAVAAAFSSTGSGMLADIIPPEHRGTAMGISNIPMFIGV